MRTVLLLGSRGYVGTAFGTELRARGLECLSPTRADLDYDDFGAVRRLLQRVQPAFVINAAGYTGKPNVDACELARADTLQGNALLPLTIAHACEAAQVPFGHVSSGCVYSGAKISLKGALTYHKDLLDPVAQSSLEAGATLVGFTEADAPNFTFRDPPCSFYSGSKALAEEALANFPATYIWRLRIPFDEFDNPRNYLTKLLRYPKAYQNYNSLSHRAHFVRACLDLWEQSAPYGTYNLTNPGHVTTRDVTRLLEEHLVPGREFEFWKSDADFYSTGAKTPRSNCILDSRKAMNAGARLPHVQEALNEALTNWQAPR